MQIAKHPGHGPGAGMVLGRCSADRVVSAEGGGTDLKSYFPALWRAASLSGEPAWKCAFVEGEKSPRRFCMLSCNRIMEPSKLNQFWAAGGRSHTVHFSRRGHLQRAEPGKEQP